MKKAAILLAGVFFVSAISGQPCSKLFFSEYIEGSGNNKALEVFNPTADTIDMNGYKIINFRNGYTTATNAYIYNLSGMLLPYSTFTVCRKSASDALKTLCQDSVSTSVLNFNGDDAIALLYDTDTIDVIGKIGEDPGTRWQFDTLSTLDRTLVRKPTIRQGNADFEVFPTQWFVYPTDDFSHIGSHAFVPCNIIEDTVIRFWESATTVSENAGTYTLVLSLNQPVSSNNVSVEVVLKSTSPASATADDIDGFSSAIVTFAPNTATASAIITITDDTLSEADENFVFVLRNVNGGVVIGTDSLFTLTITGNDSIVTSPVLNTPYYPIAIITTENQDGKADSLGVHCHTTGVVYGVNTHKNGLQFIISDHTGWLQILSDSSTFDYAVQEGDSIMVQGKITQLNGMTRMSLLDTVIRISSGNSLQEPKTTTYLSEELEARLVRVNGLTLQSALTWTNTGESFTVTGLRGTTPYSIRIDSLTSAYRLSAPTGTFDVIGWISQNDPCNPSCLSFYTINPRYTEDVIITSGISNAEHTLASVYPNPANENFTLSINRNDEANVTIYNMLGSEVYRQQHTFRNKKTSINANLPSGLYYGIIENGQFRQQFKVEIVH